MKKIVAFASLSLALTACGDKNGNPLKGYEALQQDIAVGIREVKKQTHAVCGSTITTEKLVVVEGQTASQKMTITGPNATRIKTYVFAEALPGATLKVGAAKKIDEKNFEQEYTLTYKAARGTVAYGENSKVLTGTIAPKDQVGAAISCASPVQVEVQKIKGIPAIKGVAAPTKLSYEQIADIEAVINVEAQEVTKLEDLSLTVGFDQARQSKENPIQNLGSLKLEKSEALAVAGSSYQFKVKVSADALRAAVDKLSAQNKKKPFFDFHATFKVTNSHKKESSFTHDYILRIDRKPIEAAAAPALPTGDTK